MPNAQIVASVKRETRKVEHLLYSYEQERRNTEFLRRIAKRKARIRAYHNLVVNRKES